MKTIYCIPQGTTITRVQHCIGGRGIIIEQREQRPFLLILLFDMQILKKNISGVATILLRIVVKVSMLVTNIFQIKRHLFDASCIVIASALK